VLRITGPLLLSAALVSICSTKLSLESAARGDQPSAPADFDLTNPITLDTRAVELQEAGAFTN